MLTIGVPKEAKEQEKRVGLVPAGVKALCEKGIKVLVQAGAGLESGFTDSNYRDAGAEIVADLTRLYGEAQIIQKVKEPQPIEYSLIKPHHVLFCFLHLASHEGCACLKALVNSGATAIGYETIEIDGKLPLLKPMSEIAGGLSAAYGAYFLSLPFLEKQKIEYSSKFQSELRRLAGLYPEASNQFRCKHVIIWGGGVAGEAALRMALNFAEQVTLLEPNQKRREYLGLLTCQDVEVKLLDPAFMSSEEVAFASLYIGAVHKRGQRALHVLDEDQLEKFSMIKPKVIMDISIDQGGNFPESKAVTYEDPLYFDSYGNLRFSVANIPSYCGQTASKAISEIAVPYLEVLSQGVETACEKFPELKQAINLKEGKILIDAIREAHQYKS